MASVDSTGKAVELGDRAKLQDEYRPNFTKVLVMKDRKSMAYAFEPMPCKGPNHPYLAKRIVRALNDWGVGA